MIDVWVPLTMQHLTGGKTIVPGEGKNIRALIDNLDQKYPGFKDALLEDGDLRSGIAVAVDGMLSNMGLLQKVEQAREIHFVPAIGGG